MLKTFAAYRGIFLLICFAITGAPTFSARAVVNAATASNTNVPSLGMPWPYVGTINGASAVYLGNGWALTAYHVGAGNMLLGTNLLSYTGNYTRLTNSDGSGTDVILVQLTPKLSLPTLPLARSSPNASNVVWVIGYGKTAGSQETLVNGFAGFTWSVNGHKSWGNNRLTDAGLIDADGGFGKLTFFVMDFSTSASPDRVSQEAQAAAGDSGGGVFQQRDDAWFLVGMMDAISQMPGQLAESAVYGNATYCGDIATYRSQILTVMGAPPEPTVSLTHNSTSVTVCWPDSAASYNLETVSILAEPSWRVLLSNLSSTNGQGCVTLPITSSPAFFRLSAPLSYVPGTDVPVTPE